jgi:hypothetical protein
MWSHVLLIDCCISIHVLMIPIILGFLCLSSLLISIVHRLLWLLHNNIYHLWLLYNIHPLFPSICTVPCWRPRGRPLLFWSGILARWSIGYGVASLLMHRESSACHYIHTTHKPSPSWPIINHSIIIPMSSTTDTLWSLYPHLLSAILLHFSFAASRETIPSLGVIPRPHKGGTFKNSEVYEEE